MSNPPPGWKQNTWDFAESFCAQNRGAMKFKRARIVAFYIRHPHLTPSPENQRLIDEHYVENKS